VSDTATVCFQSTTYGFVSPRIVALLTNSIARALELHIMANSTESIKVIEHPKKSGIRIITVDNATLGQKFGFSYQVNIPVKVSGKGRIRKQFPTLAKAKEFAAKEHRGANKEGEAYFKLTTKERQEIGLKVPELREKGISITEAIDFALKRLNPAGGERLLSTAIEEFQTSKRMRHESGDLADSTLRDFICRTERLKADLGDQLIHETTADQIKEWLSGLELANQTKARHLSITSQVFIFAKQKHYIRENPLDYLSDNDKKEIHGRLLNSQDIKVLTVGQADSFINYTASESPEYLGIVALGLFCGIRTEELKNLTLGKVNLAEGFVTIDGDIAKKRRMRHVTIPENAREWLTICPIREGLIAPVTGKRFEHGFRRLRLNAGFRDKQGRSTWPANGMRNSMATYLYALSGDPIKTSRELGHNAGDDTLFNHYRALAKKSDGEKFFAIKPAASAAKIVKFLR
jgi:site-specific recombinase XerC